MAKARFYHDSQPVLFPKAGGTVIAFGDFLYASAGNALPATSLADTGSEAGNQEAFHDAWIGVALEDAGNGTTAVRVATAGIWEVTCESASYTVGQLVGVDEKANGTQLEAQEVVGVATPNLAIGQVVEAATGTTVAIEIVSTVLRGGPQAMA